MSVSGYVVEPCPFCGKETTVEHVKWDNCFIVRCLHCGYTSGHIASERGAMIRHNKICRALPKPDPEWKDICAKCKDGDIEPKQCEYYGEPNGCNSPIYSEHPTAEKLSAVGDCAKLREALEQAKVAILAAKKKMGVENPIILEIIDAALAKPPRNCDVYDAKTAEKEFIRQTGSKSIRSKSVRWLYAPATEQEGDAK